MELKRWHIVIVLCIGALLLSRQVIFRNNQMASESIIGVAHAFKIVKNHSVYKNRAI